MAPVLALDLGGGADVACAECMSRSCQQDDADSTEKDDLLGGERHFGGSMSLICPTQRVAVAVACEPAVGGRR